MPFIRLSDNYIDHPKILALSDKAFRLWHEGMAFCRKHQTDGLIPTTVLVGFRYYTPRAVAELTTPWREGAHALWDTDTGADYSIHDYLAWNFSKEEAALDRKETRERVRLHRARLRNDVTDAVTNDVTHIVTNSVGNVVVPSTATDMDLVRQDPGKKLAPPIADRTTHQPNARSRWPIFKGRRLVVFDFQLEDLQQILGIHTDGFDFHQWFFDVDALAVKSSAVIPKRDHGAWLQGQLLAEARRRGLPIAGEKVVDDPYALFTKAWQCRACGDVHEGTREQARLARCPKAES